MSDPRELSLDTFILLNALSEIGNLISLSVSNKDAFREWLSADKETLRNKFNPGKVRKLIANKKGILIATDDWYWRFCGEFTHATPQTRPNVHNKIGIATAGGVVQREGVNKSIDELATVLAAMAMFVCKYFQYGDLLQELKKLIEQHRAAQPPTP